MNISFSELDALVRLAIDELRLPRDQARYILRQEFRRLKLLETAPIEISPHEEVANSNYQTQQQGEEQ
jgi:hypothetical protein